MYTNGSLKLTILLFEEAPDLWVAQSLEKDMVGYGPSKQAAVAAFQDTLQSHVNFDARHQRFPLASLKEAPRVYWQASERAKPFEYQPQGLCSVPPAHLKVVLASEPVFAS